ncbi:MAG: class I SAM-dependent methyltransferase [Oscillospiraceae bacterium]
MLDLGCGCGYDCKRLRELGFSTVGLDFSEESLRIAMEQNPGIEFLCEDMLSDYSRIGSVDAVMTIACLVHIENKDLSTAFRRMSTVLKSVGLVLFSIRFRNGKIDVQSFCTVDGEEFDRNFIGHTIDEILAASGRWFEYVTELETDMPIWEYHVLRKK